MTCKIMRRTKQKIWMLPTVWLVTAVQLLAKKRTGHLGSTLPRKAKRFLSDVSSSQEDLEPGSLRNSDVLR
jgi:hypothetical protein